MELDIWDISMLILSMLASVLIGLYFTNKNKNIEAYMLGDRRLSVLPVAVSLMASSMSALTLLGASAEVYYQGPSFSFVAIAISLAGPITAFTMLPVFYRLNVLSLYKYLQKRYNSLVRSIVSLVFMLHMVFYNAVVLYLPAMALQTILGLSKLYSILLIGLLCVLYSTVGGLKAVVWTDFFQAMLMYCAVILVGALGTYDAGGIGPLLATANVGGRLDLSGFFSSDITRRHTVVGIIIGATLKYVYTMGVNQVQIQRALSLSTLRRGKQAFILSTLFAALISILSSYVGLVIYAAYRGCDPFLAGEIERRDAVTVHYVANRLRALPGLRGIFIAGIFSATLSTLSSFANSMSALVLEDLIKPTMSFWSKGKHLSPKMTTHLAKILATFYGIVCVLMALVIDHANSRLLQAVNTMASAIGLPFLAAFALGIFTRYTNATGVLVAFLITLPLGTYITLYQVFFEPPLEPLMSVYYERNLCPLAFNMSIDASSMLKLGSPHEDTLLPPVKEPFSILNISYMILPIAQFILTAIVASIVSLLTGGWSQEVEDEYLVAWLHRGNANSHDDDLESPIDILSQRLECPNSKGIQLARAFDSISERKRRIGVTNQGFKHEEGRQ